MSASAPALSPVRAAAPSRPWELSVFADEIYPPEKGLAPALALLQRAGITHTDLRVVNGRDSFLRLDRAGVEALERTLRDHGLKVGALETPSFKCQLRPGRAVTWGYCPGFSDDLAVRDHHWFLTRAGELAERLGADQVRCFAFWREYDFEAVFGEVVDQLGQAAARARAAGQTLYLQNEPDTQVATGVELARVIRAVNTPNLRAAYDVANSARFGGMPLPDDYEALRGLLGSVQVRFQVIDVRSGWGGPNRGVGGAKLPFAPFYFWHQEEGLPVDGWVEFGGRRLAVDGCRTFLPLEDTVGLDHRELFRRLRQDGYAGRISVDPAYFLPGTGEPRPGETEANLAKTIGSLQRLVAETWA
ncbi:MAG: TIM barrel protein [Lacunisphaera sp.]